MGQLLEIKGFYVLPVTIEDCNSKHYIYFKKHDVKNSGNDGGGGDGSHRSLFMCNLPILSDLATIRKYFQSVALGATIENYTESYLTSCEEDAWVNLSKLTSDLSANTIDEVASRLPKNSAIVTFIDKASFQLAFNALKKLSLSSSSSSSFSSPPLSQSIWPIKFVSSSYYLTQYQSLMLDNEKLSEQVAQALSDFDRAEKESIENLQAQANLVDEDGFTLVVGSHRKTKAGVLGKQKLTKTIESEKAQKKSKKNEKPDFYRFQLRQRKKEEMNELLNKFKADQEKVRLMREKKRFRPY
ncbi:hypothetical protein KGF56_002780 [Candida oxycetoniae]|uniref:Ribosomal RNA-processing protein 7 C-terminal domain-containing protein n=1 Tax=Candida oxycetoniae TaxID=497107 RepID=A0AAI9SWG3_9ASCO|nr:uncharacterized protein KGF56_002780 [Candida oxycetoniae]KAI3404383.2 hypothetical protein KGF56_002780 [Candida oxycetoniae]